ncbi:MAG TPA: 50S ribosomal protein L6 [Candidatus Babeliales bacterium]|nr:50S ribosomal protein L6 [Candidatus Babeliales bacterium]
MSKIGRKSIALEKATVEIKGLEVHYKGANAAGVHVLPYFMQAEVADGQLTLSLKSPNWQNNKFWGLHRALLANKIYGANRNFERKLIIKGLGYKAALAGNKITLSLGFSHKVELDLPKGVALTIDKSGQNLVFASADKELLGLTCDRIRAVRPPEPYKGTGVMLSDEHVFRKAGKTKAS